VAGDGGLNLVPDEIKLATEKLTTLFQDDGVRLATLFGSATTGRPTRDVDVAVLFDSYHFDRYLTLQESLCQVLGTRRVDLVVLNRANAALKLDALLDGELLYAREPTEAAEAIAQALFEYDDYHRFKAEYQAEFERRCREGLSMAERQLNRERVVALLSVLDEAVGRLRRLQDRFTSFETFMADVDTRELCVHHLRIALESVLDVCRHFLAVVGVSLAELDTTNLIVLAGEKGLLDPAFARRVRGMAGMRNAIVHIYWRLDYQAVYRAVTDELADFDEFARQVQGYLPESEGG
jgi:uncharacterized protein YutE (UPF0331/DUF86 family)/predicted nucleotidyltransferase